MIAPSFVQFSSAKIPITILKHLLHSPSKYTDLGQLKTAAADEKAIYCQQMSFRSRKCIHTVKAHVEDSAQEMHNYSVHFLSIILTENMNLYHYLPEEIRLIMR